MARQRTGEGYVVTHGGGSLADAHLVLLGAMALDWFGFTAAVDDFDGDAELIRKATSNTPNPVRKTRDERM